MTQYNSLNLKLSNSQFNKLKSAIKNKTGVVLRLSQGATNHISFKYNVVRGVSK